MDWNTTIYLPFMDILYVKVMIGGCYGNIYLSIVHSGLDLFW